MELRNPGTVSTSATFFMPETASPTMLFLLFDLGVVVM